MKKTKVVCTIGPKSEDPAILKNLLDSGMNVMRLNFSHGDYEEHGRRIDAIEKIMKEYGRLFAVLLDTKGPEIRTGNLENGEEIELVAGNRITITTDASVIGNKEKISVTYKDLARDLNAGDTVLLDDGLIGMKVISSDNNEVQCEILNNGVL